MKLFRLPFLVSLLMFAALAFVGCSSKKKSDEPIMDSSIVDDQNADGGSLVLNGDSDSNTAGGLSTVYFDFDSSELTSGSRSSLDANAEFLKTNATVTVQVEGHADERGGIQYNLALGERRAKAVKDYLVAMGVDAGRVTTVSFGKERPVAFGHSEEAWSKNRRGNFVVTAK